MPQGHVIDGLIELAAAILTAAGASTEVARAVAEHLADAEAAGRTSHGLRLLTRYVDKLARGEVSGVARPTLILNNGGPIVRVAGNGAFGQIVGDFAAAQGVARARQHGVALVLVKGASHLGRNARWPELAAQQGVASIHFAHGAGHPMVVPFGGTEPRMRTSPIAFGAPSIDGNHIILDFAVAEISGNRVELAVERGERLDVPAIMLPDGTLTDDPAVLLDGLGGLLPFGGFKGYGIALFAEILAGVLTASTEPVKGENRLLSIYLDVAQLTDFESYSRRLAAKLASVRSSAALPGTDGVIVPGDRTRASRRNADRGYAPSASLIRSMREAAAKAGLNISTGRWATFLGAS